jgi:hypothetical protein
MTLWKCMIATTGHPWYTIYCIRLQFKQDHFASADDYIHILTSREVVDRYQIPPIDIEEWHCKGLIHRAPFLGKMRRVSRKINCRMRNEDKLRFCIIEFCFAKSSKFQYNHSCATIHILPTQLLERPCKSTRGIRP